MFSDVLCKKAEHWAQLQEKFGDDIEGLLHYAAGYSNAWARRDGVSEECATSPPEKVDAPRNENVVTLYFDPVFRSLSVWTMLEACQIPYEQHLINIMQGDLEKDDLKAVNPFRRLPLLRPRTATSRMLTSRNVILKYLYAEYPRHTARFACTKECFACSATDSSMAMEAKVEAALESLAGMEKMVTILVHEACGFRDERSKVRLASIAERGQC